MWRGVIFFVIFLVTFFIGMQIGSKSEIVSGELKNKQVDKRDEVTVLERPTVEVNEREKANEDIIVIKPDELERQSPADSKEHYTNKAASLLETIVVSICNFIVSIFYNLADLFI